MWLGALYGVTVILFLLILLSLGFQPKVMTRLAGFLLFVTAVAGTLLYGYGFYYLCDSVPQAVTRTLFSVLGMFLGRNDISAISAVPLLKTPLLQTGIYLTHLLAVYCTASAVIQAIGARLIRTLHLFLVRRGDLHLIYGADENTIAFAEKLIHEKKGTVVFVDGAKDDKLELTILRMGSLLLTDSFAQKPDEALLRRLGMKGARRRMTLYCLSGDLGANLRYAEDMKEALRKVGAQPEQIALTALLPEESMGARLQQSARGYGYGAVNALERNDLLARLMIKAFPPYATLSFDGRGYATEDFEAMIVGFGRKGQAVLRRLVMNGQVVGSRFRMTVVARGIRQQAGSFFSRYPSLLDAYDIELVDADAHSVELYERLLRSSPRLKYVAICTGSEKENGEVAQELSELFGRLGLRPLVLQCSDRGIRKNDDAFGPAVFEDLYALDILCGDALNEKAKVINHRYHLGEGRTAEEDWRNCDPFSRLSCQASADFSDAILAAAGTDEAAVLREGFAPDEATVDALGEMEHLRWCAFHYAMGYGPMPREIWEARARRYQAEVAERGNSALQIGKDAQNRLHACLIPYGDLDELSARENEITRGHRDYKQLDRDIVSMIPAMLNAVHQGRKGHEA